MLNKIKEILKLSKMLRDKTAQTGGVIYFVIAIVLILGVAVPVAVTLIANASLTGVSATIAGFITVFLVVGVLVMAARTSGMVK